MALTDGNVVTTMPVAPVSEGGFGGFGDGNGWWILLLLLFAGGGWGNGFGGFGAGELYPWLNNSQNISGGFRDSMLNDSITGIRDSIGNLSTQVCSGFANAETAANARQIADMQNTFALQTAMTGGFNGLQSQLASCCCDNRLASADLKYTVATENCADRTQAMQNTRDILESQTRSTQAILDKLCQLELDNVKSKVDEKNDRILDLQRQLSEANLAASQTAQNALIQNGFANEVDALYTRLSNCPVPSTPVYGRTPIFTCGNNGCGCGA